MDEELRRLKSSFKILQDNAEAGGTKLTKEEVTKLFVEMEGFVKALRHRWDAAKARP